MRRPFLLACLTLGALPALASVQVWDESAGEFTTLSEFTKRYAVRGPSALRVSQTVPVPPVMAADLRLLPDSPIRRPAPAYIEIPRGPVVIRGRVFNSPHGVPYDR